MVRTAYHLSNMVGGLDRRRFVPLLVLGAACGETQRVDTPAAPVVAVIDPGAAPRQRIRYAFAPGTTERVTLDVKLRSKMQFTNTVLQDGETNTDLPTMHLVTRFDVLAVDANGARIGSEIEDARVLEDVIDPRLRRGSELEVAKLRGLRETWHVSPTGHISDRVTGTPTAQQDPVPTAASLAQARLLGAPIEFPDVELGVGATWRVTSHSLIGKAHFDDVLTYRVKAIDGDTVSVRIELASTARDQALSTEPNASTRLTSGHVHAEVDAIVSLHGLVSVGGQHSAADLTLLAVRQHLRLTSTLTFEMSFAIQQVASSAPGVTP